MMSKLKGNFVIFLVVLVLLLTFSPAHGKKKKKNTNNLIDKLPQKPPGYPDCADDISRLNEKCCKSVKKWWMEHIRPDQMSGLYGTMIRSMTWEEDDEIIQGNVAYVRGTCTAAAQYIIPFPSVKSRAGCQVTPYCTWYNNFHYRGGCACGKEHVHLVKLLKSLYKPVFPVLEDEPGSWDQEIKVGPDSKWNFLQRHLLRQLPTSQI